MTPNLKPYPAYKSSGVEWLGDVPEHWEVRRLRNTIDMRVSNVDKHVKEGENPVRLCNYVDVYKNDYINEKIHFMEATATNEEIEHFRLKKDDVLITKDSEAWDDIGVPALVTAPAPDLISGYHLALLRPRVDELAGGYLLRALQSKGLAYQFHVEAKGVTRYGLSHSGIKSARFPLPPLPEQTAIARFLDHADRRIRRYIRAKRKLIALLEEQKQAIIHQAVTGQIDVRTGEPYPVYKPSGVKWLGDVPEHWEVKRLKWVTRLQRGYDLPSDQRVSGPYPVVSSGGVIDMHSEARSDGPGVVMGRYGSTDAVFYVEPDFWPHNTALFVTNFQGNRPRWCYYMLRTISKADHAGKSAVPGVDRKDLFEIKVAVPHIEVQDAIIEKLEEILAGLEAGIAQNRSQIDLFHEYRTRLIADVVTGKLDVREAAAALPEVDPLEIGDEPDDAIDADAEETAHELAAVLEEAEV